MSGTRDVVYFWSGSATPPTEDEITALLASTASRAQFVAGRDEWGAHAPRRRPGDGAGMPAPRRWRSACRPPHLRPCCWASSGAVALPGARCGRRPAHHPGGCHEQHGCPRPQPRAGGRRSGDSRGARRCQTGWTSPAAGPSIACWGVPGALVWPAVGDRPSAIADQSPVVGGQVAGAPGAHPAPATDGHEIALVRRRTGTAVEAGGRVTGAGRLRAAGTGPARTGLRWRDGCAREDLGGAHGVCRERTMARRFRGERRCGSSWGISRRLRRWWRTHRAGPTTGSRSACSTFSVWCSNGTHRNRPRTPHPAAAAGALLGDAAPPATPSAADGPEYRFFLMAIRGWGTR